jgi:putative hydrolases of HD superfamily
MDDFIEFLHYVGKLKKVKRTGWVTQKIKDPESVAEHTYRVTFLAVLLAEQDDLDQLKIMKMALVHDLAEGIVGDIVSVKGSQKIFSLKEKFKREASAMKLIFSKFKEGKEFYQLWKEYEEQSSPEALLLKQVDKLEMVIQALEYGEENNPKSLDEFWVYAEKFLKDKKLIELFNKLNSKRKNKN